ncbi:transglutaminase-like domain-containing protein [Deefgea piscis]|uniref:transglutaminase-like domain-containing protein n=1 Tax=Deefgea piscis TaxID=2739061 RepID=UPI001C7EA91A|nr:transglutaminase-like domain-containing protein [Deefgea piscis]QZA81988.1 transglutaminase-like domain-containing protein [Deefgea piscis]
MLRNRLQHFKLFTKISSLVAPIDQRIDFDWQALSLLESHFASDQDEYLTQFRIKYALDELIESASTDTARLQRVMHWVHHLWQHNGQNTPSQNDAMTIVEEAAQGQQFRCVEYAIVLATALAALGFPARTLSLMTQDVEHKRSCGGHVVTEVYLHDLAKWVMADAQWNIMPMLNQQAANALELTQSIYQGDDRLSLQSTTAIKPKYYLKWIKPYLYYFTTRLEHRYDFNADATQIRLMPIGAQSPKVFQRKYPISAAKMTHILADFYPDKDRIKII